MRLLVVLFTLLLIRVDAQTPVFTWVAGNYQVDQAPHYGSLRVPHPDNHPGGKFRTLSWNDHEGNYWVFGGTGVDKSGDHDYTNDLWRYETETGLWTWMSGDSSFNQVSHYGTKGVSSPDNRPGARENAAGWVDQEGNLWLFGGDALIKEGGGYGDHNDLWKYDISTNEWTWIGGTDDYYSLGIYGTKGVGSVSNMPGARYLSSNWEDNEGNFWLFGGYGWGSQYNDGLLNDLWKFEPSSGKWTWINGSDLVDQDGNYGIKGVSHPDNQPSSRFVATGATDQDGNLWLFGGRRSSTSPQKFNNDLWKYNPETNQWTWVSGSSEPNQVGNYGVKGVESPSNIPAPRTGGAIWADPVGRIWVFGGGGLDQQTGNYDVMNDLWLFDPGSGLWTWVAGSNEKGQPGTYGVKGIASSENIPGARATSEQNWTDAEGNFWLFGGGGYGNSGSETGFLNDIWIIGQGSPGCQPYASAGSDTTFCPGGQGFLLSQSIAVNDSILMWSSSGDGHFNDQFVLHAVYYPGEQDMASGTVTLTLQVEGDSSCGSSNDNLVLTIHDPQSGVGELELEYVSLNPDSEKETVLKINLTDYDNFQDSLILNRRIKDENTWEQIAWISKNPGLYRDQDLLTDQMIYEYQTIGFNQCGLPIKSSIHNTILLQAIQWSESGVTLTWNPYLGWENSLDGYEIWRRVDRAKSFEFFIKVEPNSNSFIYDQVQDGIFHSFKVVAIQAVSENQSWSNSQMIEFKKELFIPNVITPNGDGINDFFVIKNLEFYPENQLIIFNRNGKIVLDAEGYKNDWSPSSAGIYYYSFKTRLEAETVFNGWIHVLR